MPGAQTQPLMLLPSNSMPISPPLGINLWLCVVLSTSQALTTTLPRSCHPSPATPTLNRLFTLHDSWISHNSFLSLPDLTHYALDSTYSLYLPIHLVHCPLSTLPFHTSSPSPNVCITPVLCAQRTPCPAPFLSASVEIPADGRLAVLQQI